MDVSESFRRMVAAAVLAPSAENIQPWQFVVEGYRLTVCLDKSRTLSSDIGDMLSLTAIGACIENAVIAASALGRKAEIQYAFDASPLNCNSNLLPVARLTLHEGGEKDPLVDQIVLRCTSRRMTRTRVDLEKLDQLTQSCQQFGIVKVHWVDDNRLQPFAQLVGVGNRIRLEYEPFHKELFDNLRFTAAEAEHTRDGLDVATLQLSPYLVRILAALRTWPRMRWANRLGFSRSVASQAAREVQHSGAVGFLSIPDPMPQAFVEGGRTMQRIWLSATRMGLCFHPTASLPVFLAYARDGAGQLLPQHQKITADMCEEFYGLFPNVGGRTVQIAFRIGYKSDAPAVRSLRRNVDDVLQVR